MKALVTGGAGFIGSHIVDRLVEDGHEVTVLDDFSNCKHLHYLDPYIEARKATLYVGDIRDKRLVAWLVDMSDVIFHEAGMVDVQKTISEPVLAKDSIVRGTDTILAACAGTMTHSGKKHLIYASSSAVYGDSKILPRVEGQETKPISPYGMFKLSAEASCIAAQESGTVNTTILRYFNVYGPRSTEKSYSGVINTFAKTILNRGQPVIYGDGTNTRDFIHVDDVVRANILAASSSVSHGKIYNVGTGRATRIKDLLELENYIFWGDPYITKPIFESAKKGDILATYANIDKIKTELDFRNVIPIEEGLRTYLRKYYPTHEETVDQYMYGGA